MIAVPINAVPEESSQFIWSPKKGMITSAWVDLRLHRSGNSYLVSLDEMEFSRRRKGRTFQEDQ